MNVRQKMHRHVLDAARERARALAVDNADDLVVLTLGRGLFLDVFLRDGSALAAILSLDGEPVAALPVVRGA